MIIQAMAAFLDIVEITSQTCGLLKTLVSYKKLR
jgi:hypothetical protein